MLCCLLMVEPVLLNPASLPTPVPFQMEQYSPEMLTDTFELMECIRQECWKITKTQPADTTLGTRFPPEYQSTPTRCLFERSQTRSIHVEIALQNPLLKMIGDSLGFGRRRRRDPGQWRATGGGVTLPSRCCRGRGRRVGDRGRSLSAGP